MTPAEKATEPGHSPTGPQPGSVPFLLGRTSIVALIFLLLATLIGLYSLFPSSESTAARVARTGTIRIGYAVEAPFAFVDGQGRVTGESPAVAQAIWQRLGIPHIEWVQTDFASLIPQLRAGRFDQIASGLFIRSDRQQLVAFTQPSLCLQPALLVRRGNPLHLHGLNDIANQEGVRLAVITGAVEGEDAARAGIPGDRILSFPTTDLALQAIRRDLADALALSAPTIKQLAATLPDMQRTLPLSPPDTAAGCSAFAFRLADTQLRRQFEQGLDAYLGGDEHLQLLQAFGLGVEELPDHLPSPSKTGNNR